MQGKGLRKLAGLGILFLYLLTCNDSLSQAPDRDKVEKALAETIHEKEVERRQEGMYEHIFQKMVQSFQDVSLYLKLLVLAFLLTALGFGLSLVFEAWRKRIKRPKPKPSEPPLTCEELETTDAFQQLACQHRYSEAIVALHRKTVAELEGELRLKLKGYTNYMIEARIQASLKRKAFKAIAGLAERVLFARETLGRDEFLACQSLYRENFSKQQAK